MTTPSKMDMNEEGRRTNPTEQDGPDTSNVSGLRDHLRIDPLADDKTAGYRQQISQSGMLDGVAQANSPVALRQAPEAAIRHDGERLSDALGGPRRCLWDLPEIASRGWPPAACGGPRSCDGSCSRFAVHGLQPWLGALQGQPNFSGFGYQISGPPLGYFPPGPVWHVSVSPRGSWRLADSYLLDEAIKQLDGVGDANLGQWCERGRLSYQVRRRLSESEEALVGGACDIRGTPEAQERLQRALRWLPGMFHDWARQELQTMTQELTAVPGHLEGKL